MHNMVEICVQDNLNDENINVKAMWQNCFNNKNQNYCFMHSDDAPDGYTSQTCCKPGWYYVWSADCSNYEIVGGADTNMHKDQFLTFDTNMKPSYY